MPCPSRAWRVLAASLVALTLQRTAGAQSPSSSAGERVRVELELPESCAQRERFFAQVRERLGGAWEAVPGEVARTIHVAVSLSGERYVARIQLTDARGKQVVRAVAGVECEQVIDGIALITVLAIQAQMAERMNQSAPSEAPSTKAPIPPPSAEPAVGAPPRVDGTERTLSRPLPAASTMKVRIGARAGLQQGMGPGLATLLGGFMGVAWDRLSLGLAVDFSRTGQVRAQDVRAEFEVLAARLEVCRRVQSPSKALTVEPCGFFQAGSLAAQGIAELPYVSRGNRGSTSWLAPGLLVALRGELGQVFVGVEASAGIPLDRERFYVEIEGERRTVYQIPWLTGGAALGAGVAF